MTKNSIIFLLAAIVITGGAYFWNYSQRTVAIGTARDAGGKDLLLNYSLGDITTFTVKDSNGKVVTFEQKDGSWTEPAWDKVTANFAANSDRRDNSYAAATGQNLSDGTKKILKRVDTNVTIKLYVSPINDLMPQFRPVVGQVEGWLQRYQELLPEFVKVQKLVVDPASNEEQNAAKAGIKPQRNQYFGISISCRDKTSLIPWVPAIMAPFVDPDGIEFGLSAGIVEVTATRKKVVGLMSPLQLAGNAMPSGGRSQPAWAIYEAIKNQYDVRTIDVTTSKIEAGLDVLLLIHPAGITDEAQWAVDQYLLNGGRVIAFLDAYSLIASQSGQQQPGVPPGMNPGAIPTGSNLQKLLGTWGYQFDSDKIVADMGYATKMGPGASSPLLLTLGTDAVKKDNEVTKQLSDFWFIFSGAYTGSPAVGLMEKVFLTTSVKNDLVDTSYASANPSSPLGKAQLESLARNFKPEGKARILAFSLTGKFKPPFRKVNLFLHPFPHFKAQFQQRSQSHLPEVRSSPLYLRKARRTAWSSLWQTAISWQISSRHRFCKTATSRLP